MRMISSKYTNVIRYGSAPFTMLLFGIIVFIMVRAPNVLVIFKCAVVVLWVLASHYVWRIARGLATVSLGEKMLLVTHGETSVFVPFRNILSVEELPYTRVLGEIVSIELRESTALGTSIKFMPPIKMLAEVRKCWLGRDHPVVDELRGLAMRAR